MLSISVDDGGGCPLGGRAQTKNAHANRWGQTVKHEQILNLESVLWWQPDSIQLGLIGPIPPSFFLFFLLLLLLAVLV